VSPLKTYDRAYFDRWYRRPGTRVWTTADVTRKVRLALAAAEYVLGRPVRTVLDVGCGEGTWFPILRRLRPGIRYTGVDPSPYVVQRFGRRRHIRQGEFGALDRLRLRSQYDLVVACDVLHYVPTADLTRGLQVLADRTRGAAYLEAYTSTDAISGDRRGFHHRLPARYRSLLAAAGFTGVGLHLYVTAAQADALVALEQWPRR
jgi:SAM-dependent methyltransferase